MDFLTLVIVSVVGGILGGSALTGIVWGTMWALDRLGIITIPPQHDDDEYDDYYR